ncbi:hypothetical protein [Stackebrandtia soli]|uniref:hypothetical protein n=1 Tax=Stackebrandtia soli TaxID=1892856 RepID=UPI0039E8D0B0
MSDLYIVSVDVVDRQTLRGRVHLVHPDAPYVPHEKPFALALLMDAWGRLERGFAYTEDEADDGRGDRWPFSAERGIEIERAMRLRGDFAALSDLYFGRRVRVTEDGYLLTDDGDIDEPRRQASEVYALSGNHGRRGTDHHVWTVSDLDAFERRAEAIIELVEVGPLLNLPTQGEVAALDGGECDTPDAPADLTDETVWTLLADLPFSRAPYVDMTIVVRDEGHLEHLAAGARWSTAHG